MKTLKKILFAALIAVPMLAAADEVPSYKGGEAAIMSYIADNLRYPVAAQENGIEGVVNLQIVIKADGTVGPIKVTRLVDPDLEAEAIRVVKSMKDWIPATVDGKAVDATVNIPVKFTLQNK